MEPTVTPLHERKQALAKEPVTFEEHYLRYPEDQDEISLIDLWLILARHKRMMAVIAAATTVAGVAMALWSPANYEYLTSIQIGQTIRSTDKGAQVQPLETPETVLAELENGYIPRAINEYRNAHSADGRRYTITASVPKDSDLIVLKSTGSADEQSIYGGLHRAVVASVTAGQDQQLSNTRKALNVELQRARIRLQQLQDPSAMSNGEGDLYAKIGDLKSSLAQVVEPKLLRAPQLQLQSRLQEAKDDLAQLGDQGRLLKAGYRHLDDTDALLQTQIEDLQKNVTRAQSRRDQAAAGVHNGTQAMALLMLDTELQKDRTLLAGLHERREVDLPAQREKLNKQLDDNRRAEGEARRKIDEAQAQLAGLDADTARKAAYYRQQIAVLNKQLADLKVARQAQIQTAQQKIAGLQVQLERLRPTQAIATPDQTVDRVGPGRMLIVALSLVIGMLLAVFAAFGAEFLHKARVAAQQLEAG